MLPFATGESPLQHYNCLLALAGLQEAADAVLLFSNDQLLAAATAAKAAGSAAKRGEAAQAGFKEMNRRIVDCLLGTLAPVVGAQRENTARRSTDAWELVASVAANPQWKFIEVATSVMPTKAAAPLTVFQLAERALKQLPRYSSATQRPVAAISTQVILEGKKRK